jgi:hypothetical protein
MVAAKPMLRTLRTPHCAASSVAYAGIAEEDGAPVAAATHWNLSNPFSSDAVERTLEFSLVGGSQSAMRRSDPHALIVPYTREMMAFVAPILGMAAGLGGGRS